MSYVISSKQLLDTLTNNGALMNYKLKDVNYISELFSSVQFTDLKQLDENSTEDRPLLPLLFKPVEEGGPITINTFLLYEIVKYLVSKHKKSTMEMCEFCVPLYNNPYFELCRYRQTNQNGIISVAVPPSWKLPMLDFGDMTMHNEDTATRNMIELIGPILDAPLNTELDPATPFPWEYVFVAGGSVSKAVSTVRIAKQYAATDIDFFIYHEDKQCRKDAFNRIIEWFASPNTIYKVYGSVCQIQIIGQKRKYQVIAGTYTNIYDIIGKFDAGHVQIAWKPTTGFIAMPTFMWAMCCGISPINIHTGSLTYKRMIKHLSNGFHLSGFPKDHPVLNDTLLVIKNKQLSDQIIRNYVYSFQPEESHDRDYIIAQIEKETKNAVVLFGDDYIKINSIIKFDGSFNGYEETEVMDINSKVKNVIGNYSIYRTFTNQLSIGAKRVMFHVTGSVESIEGPEIRLTDILDNDSTVKFSSLMKTIEDALKEHKKGVDMPLTKRVINGDTVHGVELLISQATIDRQNETGQSICRTAKGMPFNIDDIPHGTMIRALVDVEIIYNDARGRRNEGTFVVHLHPRRIIIVDDIEGDEVDVDLDELNIDE